MTDAPRDGTAVHLFLKGNGAFVGHYSGVWMGWVDVAQVQPLVQGDDAFVGWRPIETKTLLKGL